LLTIPLSMFPE